MPRKSRKNVGLIGLGIIGSRVAAGLRASGFHVFVWNRTAKPAPNFVGSPAELAELCEIIQLFVADAQALFDVIEQMRDVLTPQHVIVCNATVGPEATIEAARIVEETGAHFLDAPFTGSKLAAEKRALVYYIGGDEATFLRARPVLEATSKAIVRIGGVGHAATIKVVTNMIAAVSIQTLGEALAIVQKAGLDPEVLAAALEQNACRSATMDMKLPKMIAGDYEAHFSLKHMFKDVQLGIHVANALDIEIPATTVTAGVMYGALNQGWGDYDFSALYKVYEPRPAGDPGLGELAGGIVQLEDLDQREVHYPETTNPAPPRPIFEASPVAAAEGETPAAAAVEAPSATDSPRGGNELPTLAAALNAPAELRPPEPANEMRSVLTPPVPMATIPGMVILPPMSLDAPSENIILAAPPAALGGDVAELKIETLTDSHPSGAAPEAAPGQAAVDSVVAAAAERIEPAPEADLRVLEPEALGTNGSGLVDTAPAPKPFNFVKRWFVARTGS